MLALITPVLAGLLLFSACGGKTTPSSSGGGGSPAGGESSGSNDVANQLESLSGDWAKTPAKISYDYTGAGNLSQLTLFWKPPSAWRMDFTENGQVNTFIVDGSKSYVCGGGAGSACIALPPSSAGASLPFLGLFTQPGALKTEIAARIAGVDLKTSNETIAGLDATCFSVTGTASGQSGTSEWCFGKNGVLLRLDETATGSTSGEFKLEATSVSTNVSSADFTPPYPVQQLPSGFPTSP